MVQWKNTDNTLYHHVNAVINMTFNFTLKWTAGSKAKDQLAAHLWEWYCPILSFTPGIATPAMGEVGFGGENIYLCD